MGPTGLRVTVFGLWHLGAVTAACLAEAGHDVVGLDPDPSVVADLATGTPPLHEPGLAELTRQGVASGKLRFTCDAKDACAAADVVWVTFDTPVDDRDQADVEYVRTQLASIADVLRAGTLILNSAQVPVGFTRSLEEAWKGRGLRYAVSPENLRLGKALDAFRKPERVIAGVRDQADRATVTALFAPFCPRIEWMGVESAEMTKHALNAYLATSVTFINEIARLCEKVGADAKEVERGLKSEGRIGPRAYLGPGAAFAGGTLARDLRYLAGFGHAHGVATPLVDGVLASNEAHTHWLRGKVKHLLQGSEHAVAAILGLTYRPGTSTLRRSASVELCRWLREQGVAVRVHDPAIDTLPDELKGVITLCGSPAEALAGADVAVVATEWPDYRALSADDLVRAMRHARVVDQNWFLLESLGRDSRVSYFAPGRPA